jgi:hypothetical protein
VVVEVVQLSHQTQLMVLQVDLVAVDLPDILPMVLVVQHLLLVKVVAEEAVLLILQIIKLGLVEVAAVQVLLVPQVLLFHSQELVVMVVQEQHHLFQDHQSHMQAVVAVQVIQLKALAVLVVVVMDIQM